jgi:hypothetical protein
MALDLFKISPQQQPLVYLPTAGKEKNTVRQSLTRRMHITKTNKTRIGRQGDARVSNAKVSDIRV